MTTPGALDSTGFQGRLLRSERLRQRLVMLALAVPLATTCLGRAIGGVVMSVDSVFYPTLGVLLLGIAYQVGSSLWVRRMERSGRAVSSVLFVSGLLVDLGVPGALLFIQLNHSPLGEYGALSSPVLLLWPLVILLSILRMNPWAAFSAGITAAVLHAMLVLHAISRAPVQPGHVPLLLNYGVLLLVIGVAAAGVARMMRRYVLEAVAEATVAEQAAQARALMEKELHVAHDIQMGLLPNEPPTLPGFDVAGMCRPAARAGGDYYDWQTLPDGRLLVVIADVSGHGIGPALVTAVCRAYARATAPRIPDACELMQLLNRLICEDVKGARFITLCLLIVGADGNVEMLSAGHGPTLLLRSREGRVELFGGDGLPLGILESAPYGPIQHVRLEPGDVLLLSTDGFCEYARTGDAELFGEERMKSVLLGHATSGAAGIVSALDQAVAEFAGGAPQEDDMTAVVVRRLQH